MQLTTWSAISRLRQTREALLYWRYILEDDFEKVQPFLVACEGVAGKRIFCSVTDIPLYIRECHGEYRAGAIGEAALVAEDQTLTWEQVQAWEIDAARLRATLCKALGLAKLSPDAGDCGDTQLIGVCERNGRRRRVYLCHANDDASAVMLAANVVGKPEAGCILFPDRQPIAEQFLNGRDVACVSLSDCVTWDANGIKAACGEPCCCRTEKAASEAGAPSKRLQAHRAKAGRKHAVVRDIGDRKAIRAEIQRLINLNLPQTEAFRQVAEQVQQGRVGQRRLSAKYNVSPDLATESVIRRVFKADW